MDYSVRKLLHDVYGEKALDEMRRCSDQFENDNGAYVWKQADRFVTDWLPNHGYVIKSSELEEDCIGYRCVRKGENYTIFVYAYGENKTSQLDGDFCSKLTKLPYAKDRIVLVLYVNVIKQKTDGAKLLYEVYSYCGKDKLIELWRVETIQGRNILSFFPRKEVTEMVRRFIAAYNNKSIDAFEAFFAPEIYIDLIEKGRVLNEEVYKHLIYLFEKFGKMKLAYLRKNDVIFAAVPYLEEFGYFGFSVSQINDKITNIEEYPKDGKYEELWVSDISVDNFPADIVPDIKAIEILAPETTRRFALKLIFESGEVKKYSLPIKKEYELDEVVLYKGYSFTDKIWRNARLVSKRQKKTGLTNMAFNNYGQGIDFINGYSIGKIQLYHDSTPFYEPAICDEVVFENNDLKITKIAEWNGCSLYWACDSLDSDDVPEEILKVLLPGSGSFNYNGISTYAKEDGTRATALEFSFMEDFRNGLAKVAVDGFGYGFVNKDLTFVITPRYSLAKDFSEGYAIAVTTDKQNVIIDKSGREVFFQKEFSGEKYKNICNCVDSMLRVSLMGKMGILDFNYRLAYYHDDDNNAGLWGYVNTKGDEVIAPQYIFAFDFKDGIAQVCKGKWEYKNQWNERENTNGWWSEEMLWGFIDKQGNEVVPCKFDEIQIFQNENSEKYETEYFKAHIGGWKEGKWGVIDRKGNWVVEPIFKDVDYTISDEGCFAFYVADKWSDVNVPMGIYSLFENRVIFEPQFLNVDFLSNGNFIVELYDKNKNKNITKVIDREGNQTFESDYSSIYWSEEMYKVTVWEDINGNGLLRRGLIDKSGKIVLPCKYNADWNGISQERRKIICKDDASGKYGMIDFEENTIIPAVYDELCWMHGTDLLCAELNGEKEHRKGLLLQNGTKVLPIAFKCINIRRNVIIAHDENGTSMYKLTAVL